MSNIEKIKLNSRNLRGSLQESLENQITGQLSNEDDHMILKFHGSYQQDDRDRRVERAQKKLEKLYSFMLRLRIAGGKISAQQWLGIHEISNLNASGVIKVTTRQTVQLHGIIKSKLKPTIASFYKDYGLDSIAACGDVNRNVMACSAIAKNAAYDEVYEFSKKISEHLLPKTRAFHEIWLDEEKISPETEIDELYGKTYLPRKFKIVLTIPPHNDVDLFAHDIGLIAIIENEQLLGFNITVGGGLGATHGNSETFPRLADMAGFVSKDKVLDTVYGIATIQRDFGNREDRKLSRFKYTIEKYGIEWLKEEFAKRTGFAFEAPKPYEFSKRGDEYGWQEDYRGLHHFTLFVENGRIYGKQKDALFEIAKNNLGDFRFTNNQNIIISNVKDKAKVEEILNKYQITNDGNLPIRLDAIACVALNTCSLALAEAQRYLPSLITKIEEILKKNNLQDDAISIRMTGCPNGCGRPYLAEIGFVGTALGKYNMHLGGDRLGRRLNRIYKKNIGEEEILSELEVLLGNYAKERNGGENFGDFALRTLGF
jgi:sulfite reductase (NADPH) hemoprotein beta-component